MSTEKSEPIIIKIENARLSFPALFTARKNDKDPTKKAKFQGTFILDKTANAGDIAKIRAGIAKCIAQDGKGRNPGSGRVALRDGAEKPELEGYGDKVMFIKGASDHRPQVVDRNRSPLTEEDAKIYAGCYVNASLRLWYQDHKEHGKRVNAALRIVQFVKDGTPFGEKAADVEKEMEDLGESDNNVDSNDASSLV